ncbi:FimV/HubP family polar landmark protein [Stutzerimonas tarimensis]|uniref:FimV/HubP family polar landmark protein n=1 Tax=Stutzerimonas tarimensis TaxID=1507735 RepID=A0ABV7T3Q0_9GAMM
MVRVRNLVLAIAATTALTSNMAFALGLGEVRLKSSLNQPLAAEIELLDARNLGDGEILPNLASIEDFNRVGVDRPYFLSDLKFTPVRRPDGQYVIQVSSSRPIREPYLNFVIEVMWPSGRLLREYTLLLDPPLYSPETVAQAAPQLPIAAPAPAVRTVPPAPTNHATRSAPAPAPAARPALGDEYRVSSRDTLWEIAERSRHGGSVHQAMLAIQDLNPDAFIDGNINRMKNGQVLRLPTAEQVVQRSRADAVALVAEQNAAWRQGRALSPAGARQLDATPRATVSAEPERSDSGDSLRLTAAISGSSTVGSDTGGEGDSAALRDQLATTRENLDSSVRENIELKERLEDLQSQLDKLHRLMELKDDQLAKLQLQSSQEPVPAAADTEESADVVAALPASAAPAAQGDATGEPPVPAAPLTPAPVPSDPGLLATVLGNPLWLGLGGGALLLVLVGLLLASRRKALRDAALEETLEQDAFPSQEVPIGVYGAVNESRVEDEPAEMAATEERRAQPSTDVLAEADVYIAYGRFTQAAELLQDALNHEPQRSDLRLKLMEVRAEMGDQQGFVREEAELREIGGSENEINQLRARYPAMLAGVAAGVTAAAVADEFNFNFDDLNLDDPVVQDPEDEQAAAGAEFDFNLDDLEEQLAELAEPGEVPVLDTAADVAETDPAPGQANFDEFSFELDVDQPAEEDPFADFDLELPEESAAKPSPAVPPVDEALTADNDEILDFDLDLHLDAPKLEGEPPAGRQELDELSFELSGQAFTLDDEPGKAESESSFLLEDFDLSLDDLAAEETPSEPAEVDELDAELDALAQRFEVAPEPAADNPAPVQLSPVADDMDEDFDFLAGTDETTTKLDLARAYIEMGDADGARDILDEILAEGNAAQQQEAREMMTTLS